MIALVARQDLPYRGREVKMGESFDAAPIDAAILTYHRKAVFAPSRTPPPDSPILAPEPPNYHDCSTMVAGLMHCRGCVDQTCEHESPEPPEPTEDEKPKRRRTYRRRDMVAEEG
jgi:hypothetical protein